MKSRKARTSLKQNGGKKDTGEAEHQPPEEVQEDGGDDHDDGNQVETTFPGFEEGFAKF